MLYHYSINTIEFLEILPNSDMIELFFWGATSVLMCFIFFLYLKTKEKIYLFYTLFLFFILIYCLSTLTSFPETNSKLFNLFRSNTRLTEPTTLTSFAFYVLFAQRLMETADNNIKLNKFLTILAYGSFVYSGLYFILYSLLQPYILNLFIMARITLFPAVVFGIIWIYKSIDSSIKFYFITGSLTYLLGALIASFRYVNFPLPFHLIGDLSSSAYFELGILIQALFFAMALGERIVMLHEEKITADKALISQLKKNHQLTLKTNRELEKEVEKRVNELLQMKENLQLKETERLKIEYQNNLIKSEIKAKQAQVNPHFIYNSMNVLKYMIQKKQNKDAISYLIKFSRLVRNLLEQIDEGTISLTQEIEYIRNYLELEKKRFDGFDYSIEISDNVDTNKIPIPPLLLQPLLESTIRIYLSDNEYDLKKIRILISKNADSIYISINNDGLSIIKFSNIKNREGIDLVKERIDLFNKQNNDYRLVLFNPKSGLTLIYNQLISTD